VEVSVRRLNAKQISFIVGSLVVAFIINIAIWFLLMGHPDEIGWVYQFLVTICLAAIFVIFGDKFLKLQIFR
jgi:hypothetical protein